MPDPVFLDFSDLEDLNQDALKLYGGVHGLRDRNQIKSALASALNSYCYGNGDLFDIAAAYAFNLIRAEAFFEGNKRTAVGAALMFLRANRVSKLPTGDKIFNAICAVAMHKLDQAGLAEVFRQAALSAS